MFRCAAPARRHSRSSSHSPPYSSSSVFWKGEGVFGSAVVPAAAKCLCRMQVMSIYLVGPHSCVTMAQANVGRVPYEMCFPITWHTDLFMANPSIDPFPLLFLIPPNLMHTFFSLCCGFLPTTDMLSSLFDLHTTSGGLASPRDRFLLLFRQESTSFLQNQGKFKNWGQIPNPGNGFVPSDGRHPLAQRCLERAPR